jgi:hypothetical protein
VTIRLSDLIEQLGALDVQQTAAMDNALRFAFGLP